MTELFQKSSRRKSAACELLTGPLALTRNAKNKVKDIGLRLPLARASYLGKPQASYISEVPSEDSVGSSVVSAADCTLANTKRQVSLAQIDEDDNDAASLELVLGIEKHYKMLASDQLKKVNSQYDERLSQSAEILQGFVDMQEHTLVPKTNEYKRKLDEITEEQANAQKKLKETFDRHQMSITSLFEHFEKNTAAIQKCRRSFEKELSDLKTAQKAENAAFFTRMQKEITSFKKMAAKLSKDNQEFANMRKSMMSLLTF